MRFTDLCSVGLVFALDSSRSDSTLRLSSSALTVSVTGHVCCERTNQDEGLPQVCGSVSVSRGQYYWEIDVCNSALYRIGKRGTAAEAHTKIFWPSASTVISSTAVMIYVQK